MGRDTEESAPGSLSSTTQSTHALPHGAWLHQNAIRHARRHSVSLACSLCALESQENDFRVAETMRTSHWSLASQCGK